MATLGDSIGPGRLLNRTASVLRDEAQRFWVVQYAAPPVVFDGNGRFLATIGRAGRGPGEFAKPVGALLLPGDSVLVLDWELFRGTVVDPTLKVGRLIRMREALYPGVVLQWPTSVVLRGRPAFGPPEHRALHEMSFQQADAQTRRSFGRGGTMMRMGGSNARFQEIAAAGDGGLWSAMSYRYELHQWSSPGEHVLSFERRPDWFARESMVWLGNPTTPPPPVIAAIQQDQEGLLWVFVRVPADNWRLGWTRVPPGAREVPGELIDVELLYDTMVEVIDPRAGTVLARERLPGYVIGHTGHRQVGIQGHDADDNPVIRIVYVTMRGKRP